MPDKIYDILIDIRATQAQVLQQLEQGMGRIRQEAEGFNNAFKTGAAVEIMHRHPDVAIHVDRHLVEWAKQGIEFNATMEQSRLGVAGVLRQFDASSYKDFKSALVDSDKVIALLLDKSNKLGLSFESMLEQYRTTANALFAGGVRDLQKQVDLTVLLQQAMASIGISGFQAQRDIFDILEGRASRTIAAKALGISDDDIARAKEAGTLYEFLTGKLQAVSESGAQIGNTFAAAEQRARNLSQQLAGVATTDVFKVLKSQLDELNALLAQPETAEKTRGISLAFLSLVEDAKTGVGAVIDAVKAIDHFLVVPEKIFELESKLLGLPFKQAYDIGQVAQFVDANTKIQNSILAQVQGATEFRQQQEARKALDNDILAAQKNVATSSDATRESAERFLHSLEVIRDVFKDIAGSAASTAHSVMLTAEQADKVIAASQKWQGFRRESVDLITTDPEQKFRDQLEETRIKLVRQLNPDADPIKYLEVAREVQERLNAMVIAHERDIALAAELNRIADEKLQGQKLILAGDREHGQALIDQAAIESKTLEIQNERHISYAEAYKIASDTVQTERGLSDQKKGQRDAQRDINDLLRESTNLLADIRERQKLISESPFLSADEKQSALHNLFIQEQQEIATQAAAVQRALQSAYGAGNQAEVDKLTEKLRVLKAEQVELGFKIDTSTFGGQIGAELVGWVNNFGTAAHQVSQVITGTLNTAIASTSQAIAGLIFGTTTWRQAFAQAAQSIVGNLIQILLQWIVSQTIMAALSKVFSRTNAQASTSAASQSAAAWSAAAISASIATEGAAAGTGTAAYLIALGAGQAAAIGASQAGGGSFYFGGPTGGVEGQFAGYVHGQEHVQPAHIVRAYGVELFEAFRLRKISVESARSLMNGMRIPVFPRTGSFAEGGAVAPGPAISAPVVSSGNVINNMAFFNDREAAARWLFDQPEGRRQLIDFMNGHAVELGSAS